ncbi:MAG: hypothetical protein V1833_02685 [Elusimicrobiota bacterium]
MLRREIASAEFIPLVAGPRNDSTARLLRRSLSRLLRDLAMTRRGDKPLGYKRHVIPAEAGIQFGFPIEPFGNDRRLRLAMTATRLLRRSLSRLLRDLAMTARQW